MVELIFDESTLRRDDSGRLDGVIGLNVGGEAFPDAHWDDFIGVILPRWLDAVTRLVRGFSTRERLTFIDGPPVIEIEAEAETLHVRGLGDARRLLLDIPSAGSMANLVETFVSGSRSVVAACEAKGLKGDDLHEIAEKADILDEAWTQARWS